MIVLRKRRTADGGTTVLGRCVGIAETLSGTLDGSNRTFYTSSDYEGGSISIFYNGQALHSPYDFIESGPSEITFTEIAPYAGDKLKALYEYDSCGDQADHGGLAGLLDDDHTQYILVNGTRAFTGVVGGITPVLDNHLTTKQYVDDAVGNIEGGNCVGVAETLSGTLDENNRIFYTAREYDSGSITVFYNGQALHSPYDFVESGPTQIIFTEIAPYVGDKLKAIYEYTDCGGTSIPTDKAGNISLAVGESNKYISFGDAFDDTNYIVTTNLINVVDAIPSIYPSIVSSKTINGFIVSFAGSMDSNNYVLEWTALGL